MIVNLNNREEVEKFLDEHCCSEEQKLVLKNLYLLSKNDKDLIKIVDSHTKMIDFLLNKSVNIYRNVSRLETILYILLIIQTVLYIPIIIIALM